MSARPPVLRVVPAPTTEPSARGGEWGTRGPSRTGARRFVQGSLAVQLEPEGDPDFGPRPTPTADLPDARDWAHRMILALLEVCDGTRSSDQLVRWVAPDIRERVRRRGQLARRRGRRPVRPPHVRALLTGFPTDGVCEVSAVVGVDGRARALALRLSGLDGRWLITAWELG